MKKTFQFFLLMISISFLIQPFAVYALDYPAIDSKIVEIYDLNNQEVIYEVDSTKQVSIASLTKIVTTITAIESIPNLDEEVVITSSILNTVQWDASKAGLKAGDRVTYRDLLYASILPSGADATNSIAILSTGSIDNFVQKMNDLATKLKLKNTHFVNVTGLDDEGHYSTADEIRQILEYALKNELFRQIYTTREYTLSNGLTVQSTIVKYNPYSSVDTSKILGSKTGYTGDAGYCLSSLSNINSHEFLIIVLNAEHKDNQYYNLTDSVNLINFLLEHFMDQVLVPKGDVVKTIPIRLSKTESYEVKASTDISLYLPDDYDKEKVKIKYDGLEELSFLNKKNEKIGKVTYYYGKEKITEEDIILQADIKMDFKKILKEYFYLFIIIPLLFIIMIVLLVRRKKKRKRKKK